MARNLTQQSIDEALRGAGDGPLRLRDGKVLGLTLWRRTTAPAKRTGKAKIVTKTPATDRPAPAVSKPRWYLIRRVGSRVRTIPVASPGDYPSVSLETARAAAQQVLADLAKDKDPVKVREEARQQHVAEQAEKQRKAVGLVPWLDVIAAMEARMQEKGREGRHVAERKRVADGIAKVGLKDLTDPRACAIAEGWIRKQKCSPLTQHRYGMHVRALGRFAARKFPLMQQRDPFLPLEVGNATIPIPAAFTLDELTKLASDAALTTDWGRLFVFLFYSGCRMREGMYARWSRIDLDTATFSVLPPTEKEREAGEAVKRGKGRTVTLQAELVEILRGWKAKRGPSDFLFPPEVQTISFLTTTRFREHVTLLGIPVQRDGKGRHIHTLRHMHVALSVACGVPDMQLRLSVGHGGAKMSEHYSTMAMLWRAKLAPWHGVFKLRDEAEVARLTGSPAKPTKVAK
jgi:integrase